MNEMIQFLKSHRSVREYDPEKDVSAEQVQAVIEAAMAAPNWINGQQVSVIEVRDLEKKAALAEACGGQKWIEEAPVFLVFCLDFYRAKLASEMHHTEFRLPEELEGVIIGSTDVGIALGTAVVAAESMGLGTVPIGGVRKKPQTFIDLLQLPEYVYPVCGLVVGHPRNIPDKKPRLPLEAVYHKEIYDSGIQKDLIVQYDEIMTGYMTARTNGQDSSNWSAKVANFYDKRILEYKSISESGLKKQGFRI